MSEALQALLKRAIAAYAAMTPEQKRAHDQAQRESFMRGFGPCEHGDYDWETCPQCLGRATPA